MSAEDPWEKREAERARFRRNSRHEPLDLFEELRRHRRALALLSALVLLLLAEVPSIPSLGRLILTILATTALLVLFGICRDYQEPLSKAWRRAGNPFHLALIVWTGLSFYMAPYRSQASIEMFRILAGAGAFAFASYALRNSRELSATIIGLLGLGCATALYDFTQFAQKTGYGATFDPKNASIFGTHESIGSLLALLLPFSLVFGISPQIGERPRLAAQAVTLVLGFAWIIARCRSAWLGGGCALILAIVLLVRYGGILANKKDRTQRPHPIATLIGSPAVLLVVALVVIAVAGGATPFLSTRFGRLIGLLEDSSFETRLTMWQGALRMLAQKPLTGWGLGAYLLRQGDWTHLGTSQLQILLGGRVGHENIAHNYYVQWAADTGTVGLTLFLATVAGFMVHGLRTLPKITESFERTLLIASLSATLGGAVEVLGSPAFQFPGVYCVFFAIMGFGMAAMRSESLRQTAPSLTMSLLVAAACAGASFGLVVLGRHLSDPKSEPMGTFQLIELTEGKPEYHPGDTVRWRAVFRDSHGVSRPTFPGTDLLLPVWMSTATEPSRTLERPDATIERVMDSETRLPVTEYSLRIPRGETGTLLFQALYVDSYGRSYTPSRAITVK